MEQIVVAVVTGIASVIAVIITNSKANNEFDAKLDKQHAVMNEKLENLQQTVNKHNQVIERTYTLEKNVEVLSEKMSGANHRIDDLERKLP